MDYNALQHKLFAMDPVDPREDLARLRAQAQGSASAPVNETVDYLQESVSVPEGSLTMDRNYSVDDFAALAGVVIEKRQRPADQVRGDEPMPKVSRPSTTGEQEHPLKDRLVGENDKDRKIKELEERIARLEAALFESTPAPTVRVSKKTQADIEDSLKESLYEKLNKMMSE